MASLLEVRSRFIRDLAALSAGQRLWLQQHSVEARLLGVKDTPTEPVVVVAQVGLLVMYWSDFEEGWELEEPDESGRIATRGSNQFELGQLVARFLMRQS